MPLCLAPVDVVKVDTVNDKNEQVTKSERMINYRVGKFDSNKYLSMAVDSSIEVLQKHILNEVNSDVLIEQSKTLKKFLTEFHPDNTAGNDTYFYQFLEKGKSNFVRFVLTLLEVLTTEELIRLGNHEKVKVSEENFAELNAHAKVWDSGKIFVTSTPEKNRLLKKHGYKEEKVLVVEIEHITPQEETSHSLKDNIELSPEWKKLVNSLGNLTLLNKSLNSKVKNDHKKKVKYYPTSQFPSARLLAFQEPEFSAETTSESLNTSLKEFSKDLYIVKTKDSEGPLNAQNSVLFNKIRNRTTAQAKVLVDFFEEASKAYWGPEYNSNGAGVKYHNRSFKISGVDVIKNYSGKPGDIQSLGEPKSE